MGMICAYYRVHDNLIDKFIQNPDKADIWITQRSETEKSEIYDLDKAWDIAQFLIKECDRTEAKILEKVIRKANFFEKVNILINSPRYLKSKEVKEIWSELRRIEEQELKASWNKQKMLSERVYRSDWFTMKSWDYIMEHVNTVKEAFYQASKNDEGLICQIEL